MDEQRLTAQRAARRCAYATPVPFFLGAVAASFGDGLFRVGIGVIGTVTLGIFAAGLGWIGYGRRELEMSPWVIALWLVLATTTLAFAIAAVSFLYAFEHASFG
jgi:hypothetical protein